MVMTPLSNRDDAANVAQKMVAAGAYYERGWSLLPLAPGKKEPHTRVLREVQGTSKWGALGKRRASLPEIRAWFECDPSAGLGILTGRASGGLVVADIDGKFPHRHPPTPTVKTGRCWHLYAKASSSVAGKRTSWGDLKGEGGYVVAPPSVHPTGSAYSWAISPSDVDLADLADLRLDLPSEAAQSGLCPKAVDIPALGEALSSLDPRATGDRLAAIEPAVAAALPVLGIGAPLGRPFRCVIPGHDDQRPSASIYRGDDGVWRYRDWHSRNGREWWALAEVRFAQVTGHLTRLEDAPTLARWWRRLFAEAGVIDLAAVAVPSLPPGAPAHVERVRGGFELLVQVRESRDAGEPMPFARRFAADWCGVSERQAREGIAELKRLGIIKKVGEHPSGHGQPMHLYRPGSGPATLQRAERRTLNRQSAEAS
jgi:hypothetical protein